MTLFYAGIFCASFLALFAIVYWSSATIMGRQIDESVTGEIMELKAAGVGSGRVRSIAVVTEFTERSPDFLYLLQSADGIKLAGNLPISLKPVVGMYRPHRLDSGSNEAIHGRGENLADGNYLFIGRDTRELAELKRLVRETFAWGFGLTIVVALAGGAYASRQVLRRIETMSTASREIIAGDLNHRLTVRGTDDEFDHLAISLNTMLDRIQVLMEGLGQVSSDIAHELRTPLTRLRQRTELATRKANDTDALRGALHMALTDIDAVLETFSALLRITQIEAAAGRKSFTAVDLTEVLKTVVEIYLPMAEGKNQTLEEHISMQLVVEGDRELLMQLFANLVENAIQHTSGSAHIAITAKVVSDSVEVAITDDGEGIPESMRSRVFRRFFRLERSQTTPGNGLGLSLAAAIATMHHTEIELADNQPGLKAVTRLKQVIHDDI
ncbi:MAG: HAMP domain-containing protein [Proteobacteria bacterium]|nr:HAMP domain-containing protein [Pseudomonadota bacterium]